MKSKLDVLTCNIWEFQESKKRQFSNEINKFTRALVINASYRSHVSLQLNFASYSNELFLSSFRLI